jgi:hypothetical protein
MKQTYIVQAFHQPATDRTTINGSGAAWHQRNIEGRNFTSRGHLN